ncbi:DNA invertase Pin-like site-specific DNA recombinase [Streptosporangium album]|uniref:DNA invertase Pin-like site-specific DNA recombinase n=1 Tax=Streptosporangium album TaxID=47479 RepID=A0A7W7W9K3_9ACTN|nr:DNA invertase Pin-like site-specific DNA recombinase [Streptosporangium album]
MDVYPDNDVSAYSGAPRPAWKRLLADIEGGTIDAIVCWHVDRLTRSPRELEDVIDLADRRGVEPATVTGEIDLATPTGRLIARMLGTAARHEAEHKAERQKRQRRQSAEAGKVSGGGMRPYGYAEDRITVIDEEAEVIREAARRMLAGESLSSVCRDFRTREITTPAGGYWTPTTLRRLPASARISGRREHTPRSADDDGLAEEVRADEEQLEELAQAWAAREISRKEWMAARAPIDARLEKSRAQLARMSRTSPLLSFIGTAEEMLSRWEAMNVSQQRAIIASAVRTVTAGPACCKFTARREDSVSR